MKILITHCPLSTDKDKALGLIREDAELETAILDYSDSLYEEGTEIFDRRRNMLITEKGYYFAFWEDEVMPA